MTFRLCKRVLILLCAVVIMLVGTVVCEAGVKLGDADADGKITSLDVSFIQRRLSWLTLNGEFSETAADVDSNGKIEIIDATLIQRRLAEMDTSYPIGEEIGAPTEPPTELPTQAPTQRPTDAEGWGHDIIRP